MSDPDVILNRRRAALPVSGRTNRLGDRYRSGPVPIEDEPSMKHTSHADFALRVLLYLARGAGAAGLRGGQSRWPTGSRGNHLDKVVQRLAGRPAWSRPPGVGAVGWR